MKHFLLMIVAVVLVGGCGKWIHIRPRELNKYGLTRKRRNRQINSLEEARLIAVKRKPGQCPTVRSLRL